MSRRAVIEFRRHGKEGGMGTRMPRPSTRVAPDTLGGRIRAARQGLHLALVEVAGDRYSTSLISQIERNRVDPSQESLRYLADRLELPLDDLVALAQHQRNSEAEVSQYTVYEECLHISFIHRLLLEYFASLDIPPNSGERM